MNNYNMTTVRRGEVWLVEENRGAVGSEIKKSRPAVVVSNDKCNEHSPTIEVVYMTTQPKTSLPTHVKLKETSESKTIGSTVLCESIYTVSKQRLKTNGYIEYVSDEDMDDIDEALLIGLDLDYLLDEQPEILAIKPETNENAKVEAKVEEAEKRAREAEMKAQEAEKKAKTMEDDLAFYKGQYETAIIELQTASIEADVFKKQYEALMDRIMTKAKI